MAVYRIKKVGMTGFEPATSSSRTKRATGLRYIPIAGAKIHINFNIVFAENHKGGDLGS